MILTDAYTRKKVLGVIKRIRRRHERKVYTSSSVRWGYNDALTDISIALNAELYVDPK